MSWPWSELGLEGPSSLEEVRRAYAQRTRETHPEEDPEGFQRLHQAYQTARRMARKHKEPTAEPQNWREEPQAQQRQPNPENRREETEKDPNWDYRRLLKEEGQSGGETTPPEEIEQSWNYAQLFEQADQENESRLRRELQAHSGLTDENDDWEQVIQVLRQLDHILRHGMNPTAWAGLLNGSGFERVRKNSAFLLGLERWLETAPPLDFASRSLLLNKLGLSPEGRIPEQYQGIYALLNQADAQARRNTVYYQGKRGPQKNQKREMLRVVLVCVVIFIGLLTVQQYNGPSAKQHRQEKQLSQWLSQDLGMTVEPYHTTAATGKEGELRFQVKEMPKLTFSAFYEGERDTKQEISGYRTNFSDAAFDWALRNFAQETGYGVYERSGWRWTKAETENPRVYYLEFPLAKSDQAVEQLDEFYQQLEQTEWYQKNPPEYTLSFTRSGVCYFTLEAPKEKFEAEPVAEYCKKTAPESICAFLVVNAGLDKEDSLTPDCGLFQLEPGGFLLRFPLPVGGPIYIHAVYQMYAAQNKVIAPALQIGFKLLLVVQCQTVLDALADQKAGDFQMIVFLAVALKVKDHIHFRGIVHMVGEADFLHTGILGGQCHFQTRVVSVE